MGFTERRVGFERNDGLDFEREKVGFFDDDDAGFLRR